MKRSTRDRAEGKLHEVKGTLKEQAGKLSVIPELEVEGKDEKRFGKVQQVIGKVEKALGE